MADSNKNKPIPDHDYDGIQELNNDLPPWWLWLFYITIIWSIVYLIHYHVIHTGDSSKEEYLEEMNSGKEERIAKAGFSIEYHSPFYKSGDDLTPLKREQLALAQKREEEIALEEKRATEKENVSLSGKSFDDIIMAAMDIATPEDLDKLRSSFPEIWDAYQKRGGEKNTQAEVPVNNKPEKEPEPALKALTDEASLSAGKTRFLTSCAICHGKNGEGGYGPNLTDNYFLHGHSISDMVSTIKNGVPAKGMISWRSMFSDQQILEVASYIQTLIGSHPPNAKAPQGVKVDNPIP